MNRRRSLPKRFQTRLEDLSGDLEKARDEIKAVMREALSDRRFWAGETGKLKKREFLKRLGFDVKSSEDVAQVWQELVSRTLLRESCRLRVCFALEALGFDAKTWLMNHGSLGRRTVSRIAKAFNDLLAKEGYGTFQARWCATKKAVDFFTRVQTPKV